MGKEPYVKVSAAFYLKNASEGRLGLRHENWNFGNKPCTLDQLIFAMVFRLSQFYSVTMPDDVDAVNAAIKKAGEAIMSLQFEEEP